MLRFICRQMALKSLVWREKRQYDAKSFSPFWDQLSAYISSIFPRQDGDDEEDNFGPQPGIE